MSNDQLYALGRQLLALFSGAAGTWLVSHGYLSATQWSTLSGALGSIASIVLTAVVPIVVSLWAAWHAHSTTGRLESVGRLAEDPNSPVKHVELENTPEGRALAQAVPSNKVSVTP